MADGNISPLILPTKLGFKHVSCSRAQFRILLTIEKCFLSMCCGTNLRQLVGIRAPGKISKSFMQAMRERAKLILETFKKL